MTQLQRLVRLAAALNYDFHKDSKVQVHKDYANLQTLPSLIRLSLSLSSWPAFTNSGPSALQWPHLRIILIVMLKILEMMTLMIMMIVVHGKDWLYENKVELNEVTDQGA